MSIEDQSFSSGPGLVHAIELLNEYPGNPQALPEQCPQQGIGELATLDLLGPHVLGGAAQLDRPDALAHMDPPTPWITWAMTMWNARLNQNLLHPGLSPFAMEAEKKVIDWLGPFFGMQGGQMCSGSTLANLTALWAAREVKGIRRIVGSEASHLSIRKSAQLLGLTYEAIPTNDRGQIDIEKSGQLSDACLVLTAGTTTTGEIDSLELAGQAKWTHVDAAWAGPLRMSPAHRHLLEGIEKADSVAVSAHKWLFQPKDSALILYREPEKVVPAISFGGGYLTSPNVGIQGSRGASAIPLLATLTAWGIEGLVARIDHCMATAYKLAKEIKKHKNMVLWGMPKTGVTVFRPQWCSTEEFFGHLPEGMLSTSTIGNQNWLRSVAANPVADIEQIISSITSAINKNITNDK